MLEVVFDRLVRMMSTSLRNFTSDNVEVSLDNISSARFGDYLNSIPLPAMLAVFKAEEWDNFGLMTVDSALIYSIVDVLLGVLAVALPSWVESAGFRDAFDAFARERLGRTVSYGDVRVGVLPPRVDVEALEVGAIDDAAPPAITARRRATK